MTGDGKPPIRGTDLSPEHWSRRNVRNWAIGLAPISVPTARSVSRSIEQLLLSTAQRSSGEVPQGAVNPVRD